MMVAKRTHSAIDAVHPSRQSQVPGSIRPTKKPRRVEPPTPKKQAHASSVNAIKKRIRDVKRRLERSQNLPATVRMEDERALAAYQQELAVADEEKTRQKMIKKYHMVRFFERQKATRQLKKLRKRLLEAQSDEDVTNIKARLHIAEVDLNYTQYFPLYKRYVSLYPLKDNGGSEKGNQDEHLEDIAKKPLMWAEVEKRMTSGTLRQLRDASDASVGNQTKSRMSKLTPETSRAGSGQVTLKGTSSKHSKSHTKSKEESARHSQHQVPDYSKRKASEKVPEASNQDGDSDGGFFEE